MTSIASAFQDAGDEGMRTVHHSGLGSLADERVTNIYSPERSITLSACLSISMFQVLTVSIQPDAIGYGMMAMDREMESVTILDDGISRRFQHQPSAENVWKGRA